MVQIVNPLTIVNVGGGGGNEPGGNIKITAYDTTTGVISGGGFGSTAGTVYVLDRDTNTYVAQTVSSWEPASITLAAPVDLTTLEGTTSMAVVADDGTWSNKWLLTGDVAVSGWGKLYLQNPDTRAIYTMAVTSQTNFEKLYGANNGYSGQILIGSDTFYTDEILGFQFGSDFNLTAIGDYFLAYCANLVQPVVLPSQVTSIGAYFLSNCFSFNQPITIPSTVTSIENNFLYTCYSFNQPLTIPSTVTSIGIYFLAYNRSFNQPITIPSTVTSIGEKFLYACYSFNQPLTIPSTVTSIGTYFLAYCYSFNQPITIPSTVTSIGTYFLHGCYSFSNLTVDTTTRPTDSNSLSATTNTVKMYVKGVTVKGTGRATWISGLPNRTSTPFRKLIDGGE